MTLRHPTAAALAAGTALALTGSFAALPAWADCAADLQAVDEEIVAAETGAASGTDGGSDMPATKHQEEVLSGAQDEPMETAAGDSGDVEATTPHQRDVVRGLEADSLDAQTRDEIALLVTEARAALQEGDEAGCRARMDEVRRMIAQ